MELNVSWAEVKAAGQEFKAQAKADETLGRLNIGEKSHLEGETQGVRLGSMPLQRANGWPGDSKQGNQGPCRIIPVKTTMICTHVLNRGGKGVKSPVDDL